MATRIATRPSTRRRRDAVWVAHRVGRADVLPVPEPAVESLASLLDQRAFRRGDVLFLEGQPPSGVWIVREGVIELAAGPPRCRAVIKLLRPGDVEGDVELVLGKPNAYDARALSDGSCLYLDSQSFDHLLTDHPVIARRWLAGCMQRLERAQGRILELLGASLQEQVARLILDEAVDGAVRVPQRTLAAMLGVRRQSLNKTLKELELKGVVSVAYADVGVRDEGRLRQLALGTELRPMRSLTTPAPAEG
jgi:CRP-like cAMP-binding protein